MEDTKSKYVLAINPKVGTKRVIKAETLYQLQDKILFDTLEHECKDEDELRQPNEKVSAT
jgi:hypothetical protein